MIIPLKAGISGSPFKPKSKITFKMYLNLLCTQLLTFPFWVLVSDMKTSKVNSVQEACTKCFVVHTLKFEILQTTLKNKTKTSKC